MAYGSGFHQRIECLQAILPTRSVGFDRDVLVPPGHAGMVRRNETPGANCDRFFGAWVG